MTATTDFATAPAQRALAPNAPDWEERADTLWRSNRRRNRALMPFLFQGCEQKVPFFISRKMGFDIDDQSHDRYTDYPQYVCFGTLLHLYMCKAVPLGYPNSPGSESQPAEIPPRTGFASSVVLIGDHRKRFQNSLPKKTGHLRSPKKKRPKLGGGEGGEGRRFRWRVPLLDDSHFFVRVRFTASPPRFSHIILRWFGCFLLF